MGRNQRTQRLAAMALPESIEFSGRMRDCGLPISFRQSSIRLRDLRLTNAHGIRHKAVVQPPCITHPGLIYRVITARYQPPDAVFISTQHDVAAVRTARTYARGF